MKHGLYWKDKTGSHTLFATETERDSLFDILRDSARVTFVESFNRDESGDDCVVSAITKAVPFSWTPWTAWRFPSP